MTEVTQDDRELAKNISRQNLLACYYESDIDAGKHDHVELIQQIARHRTTAVATAVAERDARIAELEAALAETREMLGLCEQVICDECCPTTWRTVDGQPHSQLHKDIQEVLFKHEHLKPRAAIKETEHG